MEERNIKLSLETARELYSEGGKFKYLGLNTDDYKDLKWEDGPVEVFLKLDD